MAIDEPDPHTDDSVPTHSRTFEALKSGAFAAAARAAANGAYVAESDDEMEFVDRAGTFSKGLVQAGPGRVDLQAFRNFRNSLYGQINLDWHESSDLAAPAPPRVTSLEYAAELVELFWASLLRDVPFSAYEGEVTANAAARELDGLGDAYRGPRDSEGRVTPKMLFRGGLRRGGKDWFAGEALGPYVSQFLLIPTTLGAQPLDQRFRTRRSGIDYLVEESDWSWVQNGGQPSDQLHFDPLNRHLRDARGLAGFAHEAEVIQAYAVARRIMGDLRLGANPGSPYAEAMDHRARPFRSAAPDFIGTLHEVARAARKAVTRQLWAYLRHRPEAGGGLLHLEMTHRAQTVLRRANGGAGSLHEAVLSSPAVKLSFMKHGSYLLPQAFPEGAPAYPAYPSDRAAIAGACVTALKFFYDCERPFSHYVQVVEAMSDGLALRPYAGIDAAHMTFNSELSKLAHNVAFGHGLHAGANWRSDVEQGLIVGEAAALNYFRDRARASNERYSIRLRRFDGEIETIAT